MGTSGYLYFSNFFHPLDEEVKDRTLSFVNNSCENYFAKMETCQKAILKILERHQTQNDKNTHSAAQTKSLNEIMFDC